MDGEEEVSIKELASNLTTYKEQLQQVKNCLISSFSGIWGFRIELCLRIGEEQLN